MGPFHQRREADRGRSTDLTGDAYMAFYKGRKLINDVAGALTPEQFEELKGYRNDAVNAWEKAIAATVIHYINDVLSDMAAEQYDFLTRETLG